MQSFTRITSAFLTVVSLAICGVGCSPKAKLAKHLARADRYFDSGEYDNAEIEYLNVIQIERENFRAVSRLGTIYFDEGRYGRAVPCLYEGCKLATNNVDLRLKLGVAHLLGHNLTEARKHIEFVLDQRPEDPEAPLLLVKMATNPQNVEATRERLQKLPLPEGKRAPVEVALGMLALEQHDLKAAEVLFKQAQTNDPKFCAAYGALGALYSAQNDLKQADQALKTAAELAPDRSAWRLQYAQFKARTGDPAAGRELLEAMVKKTPDYLPAWIELADIAARQTNCAECESLIKKLLARDPVNYDSMLLSGRFRLLQGDAPKAVGEFDRMAKFYPKDPQVQYQLALAQLADHETGKAIVSLNHALMMNTNFVEAILVLADLRIRNGDFTSAIISLKRLVEQAPQIARAQLMLAGAYRAQGNFDEALQVYHNLSGLFPRNAELSLLRGMTLREQNKRKEAAEAFANSLELAPEYLPAMEQLVALDLQDAQFTNALQRVEKQLAKSPTMPELRVLVARIFLAQRAAFIKENDPKQADAALNRAKSELLKAVELKPDFRAAYLSLATLYVDSHQNQEALDDLRRVLNQNPKDTVALMLLGTIQEKNKDYDAARDTYERLLTIDPKFSAALNNLAYLYSEHYSQFEKAYDLARRARELLPYDPSTADTLGWVLYQRKNYARAASLLQEGASTIENRKLPTDPEIQFHLGMCEYMMGEEQSARTAFERALRANREFRGITEASNRLAVLTLDERLADARPRLSKRISEQPDDPVALAHLARLEEREGMVDKAMNFYEAALKVNPKNLRVLIALANLYSRRPSDVPKAFELAKAAYSVAPDDAAVSPLLGGLAFQTGDFKWALSLFQDAAQKRRDDPELLFHLAECFYSVGKIAEAEATTRSALQQRAPFSRTNEAAQFLELLALAASPSQAAAAGTRVEGLVKSNPDYVPALMVLAAINEQNADMATAKQYYERAWKRFPEFSPAIKRLAVLYSEAPTDEQKAYQLALKAREAFPDDAEVAKALGILVYRQKDYARSVRLLKESAAQRKDDAIVFYYLGLALSHDKDHKESKAALQCALDLHLRMPLADDAKRVMGELK
jgi:tetratricopeptide (TPR) repeat protein